MTIVLMTFVITTAAYGTLVIFAIRRLAEHMKLNPEASKAISEHVIVPLLGRKPQVEQEQLPNSKAEQPTSQALVPANDGTVSQREMNVLPIPARRSSSTFDPKT